ncbi:SDR family NAD(P)-dependent oxidoreductase [Lactococcus nasutitermitis]|uniref:SDR family NAD(P)-dependent oxidoreductase n=1 Tax=Lactococcus nasutitermitis TaxID=1652957 RepID=A0ABV9JBX6_9LACT|nr:SDR family NAD(P)-dependent oxidoreductase [Lactococcus nasutitermitis]
MNEQKAIENYHYNFKTSVKKIIKNRDLTGKIVVVTGGYSGIGLATVQALACAGARVVVPARRIDVAQKALAGLVNVKIFQMDLMAPASISRFAKDFLKEHERLDILINAAGIMYVPLRRDKRGIESHFATNHLGHFQLTLALLPALKKSGNARVINLSSRAQQSSSLLDDWNFTDTHHYTPQLGYQQSKTANVLFSVALDARGKNAGIRSFAVHPGMIPTTNIGREHFQFRPWQREIAEKLLLVRVSDFFKALRVGFDRSKYRYFKTIQQGAASVVWAATSPDLADKGGLYLEDCNIARLMTENEADNFSGGVRPHSIDPRAAERLWQISVEQTGSDF